MSSTASIRVRPFHASDAHEVRKICFSHFRSLALSAVVHYVREHFQDLVMLVIINKFFVRWNYVLLASIFFLLYLFIRAKGELECYIRRHCPDLDDILTSYVSDPKGNFWVAEFVDQSDLSQEKNAACEGRSTESPTEGEKDETVENKDGLSGCLPLSGSGAKKKSGRLCGCIGILPYRGDPKVAQLMRLVVATSSRRMRIGSRLLAQLEEFAKQKGFQEVRLFTNNLNRSHMTFVKINGYEMQQIVRRGLMRGDLLQWRKLLDRSDDESRNMPHVRQTAVVADDVMD